MVSDKDHCGCFCYELFWQREHLGSDCTSRREHKIKSGPRRCGSENLEGDIIGGRMWSARGYSRHMGFRSFIVLFWKGSWKRWHLGWSLRIDRKVKSVWKAGVQVGKREEDQVERKPVGEIEILWGRNWRTQEVNIKCPQIWWLLNVREVIKYSFHFCRNLKSVFKKTFQFSWPGGCAFLVIVGGVGVVGRQQPQQLLQPVSTLPPLPTACYPW